MKRKQPEITAEQFKKVYNALQEIEQAQNTLYGAAQLICSVPHYANHWGKVCKLGDKTKALWHEIDELMAATVVVDSAKAQDADAGKGEKS